MAAFGQLSRENLANGKEVQDFPCFVSDYIQFPRVGIADFFEINKQNNI